MTINEVAPLAVHTYLKDKETIKQYILAIFEEANLINVDDRIDLLTQAFKEVAIALGLEQDTLDFTTVYTICRQHDLSLQVVLEYDH